jgi:hypothetical protein
MESFDQALVIQGLQSKPEILVLSLLLLASSKDACYNDEAHLQN